MFPVALVRLPLGFLKGPGAALAITDATLLAAATHDAFRRGAPHSAFVFAQSFLIATQGLTIALVVSSSWSRFVAAAFS